MVLKCKRIVYWQTTLNTPLAVCKIKEVFHLTIDNKHTKGGQPHALTYLNRTSTIKLDIN